MSDTRAFNASHVLLAFLAGAAVGAVTALLTAPRTGRETRDSIRETAHNVKDRAVGAVERTYERASRATQAAREALRTAPAPGTTGTES